MLVLEPADRVRQQQPVVDVRPASDELLLDDLAPAIGPPNALRLAV